jgi:hypothetical protein
LATETHCEGIICEKKWDKKVKRVESGVVSRYMADFCHLDDGDDTSSPKRTFLQDPHSVTSQKTAFFTVTAVKTSHLNNMYDVSLKC